MRMAKACVLVLAMGLALPAFVSHVAAQDSKKRDDIIAKCIARAHKEYPDPGESETFYRGRAASYKACMAENGQAP